MTDNQNSRKKALIISVLAFLLAGGGVFLFFVIQGSNDLTGANKKNFYYGSAARGAATSFFKFLGFDSLEPMTAGTKERPRLAMYPELAEKGGSGDGSASAKADDPLSDWGGVKGSGRGGGSASPTSVPRMSGAGLSGAGGISGGGSKSSGGISRFGEGSDAGNVKVSGKSLAMAGQGASGKGALGSLQNARALLGEGLRSGSAMTAHSKWNASFGVGGARGGKELAYGARGLVDLDKVKSGEIDNLKTTDIKSLKTPEVSPLKKEDSSNMVKDDASKKSKADAEDTMKKDIASAVTQNAAQQLTRGGTSTDNPAVSCDESAGPQTATCSAVLNFKSSSDKNITYTQMGKDGDGNIILKADYVGEAQGIMEATKGRVVPYTDTCSPIVVNPKTGEVISMGTWSSTEKVDGVDVKVTEQNAAK